MKLLTALIACVALVACTANQARQNVLLPAVSSAWIGVQSDLDRGLSDAVNDGEVVPPAIIAAESTVVRSLAASNPLTLGSDSWILLQPYVVRGIHDRVEDGELSPLAEASLLERARLFGLALESWRTGL